MQIRDNHHVPARIRIGIEAEEVVFGAKDDSGSPLRILRRGPMFLGVLNRGDHVAKNAMKVAGPCVQFARDPLPRDAVGGGYIGVAPRRPEVVHIAKYSGCLC